MESMTMFNNLFVRFRMPLFFFISGFVLYKSTREWTIDVLKDFLRKKALVQIVPTVFFLVMYIWINDKDFSLFQDSMKGGYWFTIALFLFFCIYSIIQFFLRKCHSTNIINDISVIVCAIAAYLIGSYCRWYELNHVQNSIMGIIGVLGLIHLRFFLFFCFGTLVKKYFDTVQKWMDNEYIIGVVIMLFFGITLVFSNPFPIHTYNTITFIPAGLCGILVVFAFFRKYQDSFSQNTWIGRILQYIGKRTLDIYLLHYFFLPRNIQMLGSFFQKYENPIIEASFSFVLAIIVIAVCLVVSNIIRMSPFLGHYLFGVKR